MNVSTIESFNITSGFLVYEKVKEEIIEHLGFTISKNNYNHYTNSQLVASRTSLKPTGGFSSNFLYMLFTNGVNFGGSSNTSAYQPITAITIEPKISNSYETSSNNVFSASGLNSQLYISNLDNKLYVIKNEGSIMFINRAGDLYSILKITITDNLLLVNSNYGYKGGSSSYNYLEKIAICPSYKSISGERSTYCSSLFKSFDGQITQTFKPESTLILHNEINRFSNEYNKVTSFISPIFCFSATSTAEKDFFVQPLDGNTTTYNILALEDKDYGIVDMQLMKPEEEFTIGAKKYIVFPSGKFSFINQNVGIVLRIL